MMHRRLYHCRPYTECFLKSTCGFCPFIHHHCFFWQKYSESAFLGKTVVFFFFLLSVLFFQENTTILKALVHMYL